MLKNKDINIQIGDIVIVPLRKNVIESLRKLRNQKENRSCFFYQEEITKYDQETWYKKYITDPTDIMFFAFHSGTSEVAIGYAALYRIDFKKHTCEFGRLLVEEGYRNQGIGYKLTMALCQIAFKQLGMKIIYLSVFSSNLSAINLYKQIGFREVRKSYIREQEIIYMEYKK